MTPDEAALERLRAYAAIEKRAAERAQQESLARAADIVTLFRPMLWVPEMDERHPVGRKDAVGRPNDPQSYSRFTRWITGVRGVDLHGSHLYRLKTAHEIIEDYFATGEIMPRTEWEVRPFARLRKQGYGDQIPSIWASVTAEGEWTARTVTEKIADFRKGWTRGQARAATAAEKLSAKRSRALSALEQLWELDSEAAVELVNFWAKRHNLTDEDADEVQERPDLRAV